jgi:amino acid adenylation domain-containing protein
MTDDGNSLTTSDLESRLAALSPEKRALLAQRLASSGSPGGRHSLPLSFAQQRMWFLDQWNVGTSTYNVVRAWWLEGALDARRLHVALSSLIARHEALRTAIVNDGGQSPQQRIVAQVEVDVPVVDLRALPMERARIAALSRAKDLAVQGFDLTRPPLLRMELVRVADACHLLVLVIHHIVTDGWSQSVLLRELATFYAGDPISLPPLRMQYADYAVWQREQTHGPALERQLSYWRGQLANLATLELPSDRPRPQTQSYRGACHSIEVSSGLTAALRQLSRHERVTLYMTLLAAFQVLVARYTGQDDVAVGTPIAGRDRPEFEPLIGCFVNTLVMRSDLSGNPRFRELLARVRETSLDAYANQGLPFEKLVEELHPQRDTSRNPLCQLMLALQNVPPAELTLAGVTSTRVDLHTRSSKFDLALLLTEEGGGLNGVIEYATDLFDAVTIARLASHFTTLLEGIVANPDARIGELTLLGADERALLIQWNETDVDYRRERCIHQLFEEQATRTPDAVAAAFEATQLTYAQLDARANQLAHHLVALGVGPDVPVGLCLRRSLDLPVALLGVLKAGGAYVPLDPDYPPARLAFMLEDTKAPVLLTQESLLGQLPHYAGHVVCLDRDVAHLALCPSHSVPQQANASHLAYILYTSGSTGQPKGVMIEHRGLANYVLWLQREFGLLSNDRVLQSTPATFDISILELFWPLIAGATLEIASPQAHRSPKALIDVVKQRAVTLMQVVPSMLGALVDESGFAHTPTLRRVFTAGEALQAALVQRFFAQSSAELVNGYGPTETTVYSTYWRCTREGAPAEVPIGRPIANTRVHILDAFGAPVPIGVAGELCISGEGVARGYLGRPDLTAHRFVSDPSARDPAARMYRTGDRARHLADGTIAFLGRIDHQVKLRGFRIELGEIEAVLSRQPGVGQAVVLLREDVPGDPRLVAYVVAPLESSAQDLRAALRHHLPEHMIPATVVHLPALPLTANGKIDRKSLPVPEYCGDAEAYRPPRTPLEKAIAAIWAETLHLPQVGITDDFFDGGGHSLLAVQLLNKINASLDIELTLRQLFGTPTVHGLALAAMEQLMAEERTEADPQ